MPDIQWRCEECGDRNPAFTEVCRNCSAPASSPAAGAAQKATRSAPTPLFDTGTFRSFRYRTLDEISQNTFGIDPRHRRHAWLIFPVFSFLAFLMIIGAVDTFETGQTHVKGGRLITGQAAYLNGAVRALIGVLLPILPIRGPKWFSTSRRCLWAVIALVLVWSLISGAGQLDK